MTLEHGQDHPRPHDGWRRWVADWVSPPTLIALLAFGAMSAQAHYRLGELERDLGEIALRIEQERTRTEATYQRRDVLLERLVVIDDRIRSVQDRLVAIEATLTR